MEAELSAKSREVAAVAAVIVVVVVMGVLLGAWVGFPKGVDAYQHLTRLKFVADHFPHHNWFYAWAAGMPMFDNYPGLPYVAALPFVRLFGDTATLELMALAAMVAFGLGLYGHLRVRTGRIDIALLAALMVVTSMAIWHFTLASGVYARVVAMGFGGLAWWAHAMALSRQSGRWWALTAVLIAATIACHPVTGAFVAGYVALVQLSERGFGGIRPLIALAGLSFLLAAQPILSSLSFGIGGTILGVDRPELGYSSPVQLIAPQFAGFAAFCIPTLVVLLQLPRRFWRSLGAGLGLLAIIAYMFAPNWRVPTRYYYINGIDPATVPYFLVIVGGLCFAALAPSLSPRIRRVVLIGTTVIVAVNAAVAVPAMYASGYVNDTSSPGATEQAARRSLIVDGDDLAHRIAPLSATESVMFNYFYRKPELRDYYAFAQLNVDWLYFAYDTLYHPPINVGRYQAVLDWYALDAMTFSSSDDKGEPEIASLPFMHLVPETRNTQFRLYRVDAPTTIGATTTAPLVVVIGARSDYDRVARLLFDEGASPRTRVPVWWNGTLADLPDDLLARSASVIVVGDHLGDALAAARNLDVLTNAGTRIIWDVGDLGDASLPAPWPASAVRRTSIDRWVVKDRAGRIMESDFSPASFEGGPWGATVPVSASAGATTELSLGEQPLVISTPRGKGTLTIVGGNLLYHAQSKASAAERRYVLSFLGDAASGAETAARWQFVDPERREIETDGAAVLLKESIYPKWSARFVGLDGAQRPLRIAYAGPGLMLVLPPGPGTVIYEYSSTLTVGWIAWGLTIVGGLLALLLARRPTAFVPAPPRPRYDRYDDDIDDD
ncbi:MAG: hypothetical protein E6J49_14070 [Chloroflexi bacterium]|nr:MAG: hypothetical protein E6J49_14070 [Chloroflexota bacterium]